MSRISAFLYRHRVVLAILGIWSAGVVLFLSWMLRETDGRFIYNLDDAYIHLAIAKHIVRDGVWGVTPFAFSSSSSSILWPLLLAGAFYLTGVQELLPFGIAWISCSALIMILYREWRDRLEGGRGAGRLVIAWLILLPLWPILFNGMETALQMLSVIAVSAVATRTLSGGREGGRALLMILCAAVAAIRYEGCFLVAVLAVLLVLRKRWVDAAVAAGSAAMPVLIFGGYAMAQGWSLLPNSLLIKHGSLDFLDPLAVWQMLLRPAMPVIDIATVRAPVWPVLAVLLAGVFLLRSRNGERWTFWDYRLLPGLIFLATAAIHSMLITSEMFFRYQAYLLALGAWAVGCALGGLSTIRFSGMRAAAQITAGCAAVILAVPVLSYSWRAVTQTPVASRNIFEQQYQMGLFLKEYYDGGYVAANDIGAVNFLADLHLTDLFGLASRELMEAKLGGELRRSPQETIKRISTRGGAEIAVLYDAWFLDGANDGTTVLPADWIRVADWTISGNVVCGSPTITWYALGPAAAPKLLESLRSFEARLPQSVAVSYFDTR